MPLRSHWRSPSSPLNFISSAARTVNLLLTSAALCRSVGFVKRMEAGKTSGTHAMGNIRQSRLIEDPQTFHRLLHVRPGLVVELHIFAPAAHAQQTITPRMRVI